MDHGSADEFLTWLASLIGWRASDNGMSVKNSTLTDEITHHFVEVSRPISRTWWDHTHTQITCRYADSFVALIAYRRVNQCSPSWVRSTVSNWRL